MKKCLLLLLAAACFATVNAQSGVFKTLTAPDQTYYTIGGYLGSPIIITKYLSSGIADQSYGTDGSTTVAIHPFDAMLVSTGKMLIAGTTPEYADGHPDRLVVRLTIDGALDPTFRTITESASPLSFNSIESWVVSNNRIGIIGYSASLAANIAGNSCSIYDTAGVFIASLPLSPPASPISNYRDHHSVSFVNDKIIVYSQIYVPNQGYTYTTRIYNADGSPYIPGIVFSCPKDTIVATNEGVCNAVVNGLDPVIIASGNISDLSYLLTGATTGNGIGSVSGISFYKGITTVQYTQTGNAANSCSFTVTVEDRESPVISNVSVSQAVLWPPNQKMQTVEVNYISQDNCGIVNSVLSVNSNELSVRGSTPGLENDWVILNNHQVQLRATQGKNPKERVYTIAIASTDAAGNQAVSSVDVSVANEKVTYRNLYTTARPAITAKPTVALQVNVLPNPAVDQFTLLTNSNSSEKISMRVINELGTVVEVKSSLPAKGQLQIGSGYPAGMYVAIFTQGLQTCLVKLLKQQ